MVMGSHTPKAGGYATCHQLHSLQPAAIRDAESGGFLPAIEPPYALSQAVAPDAKLRQFVTDEASQLDKS